jgi:hypothetical protein
VTTIRLKCKGRVRLELFKPPRQGSHGSKWHVSTAAKSQSSARQIQPCRYREQAHKSHGTQRADVRFADRSAASYEGEEGHPIQPRWRRLSRCWRSESQSQPQRRFAPSGVIAVLVKGVVADEDLERRGDLQYSACHIQYLVLISAQRGGGRCLHVSISCDLLMCP